jgi:sulfonate transport system permease protein
MDERADLPAPSLVWNSAVELSQGELWSHLWISLQRLLWGLLAGIQPVRAGCCAGLQPSPRTPGLPTFASLAQVPTLAWIPLSWCFSASAKC